MELAKDYSRIQDLDAEVLAISTDDLSGATSIAQRVGVPFPLLYDPDVGVVEQYGVYNLLRDGLAAPAVFIIDKQGVIRYKYVGMTIGDRPRPSEVIAQLRLLDG